MGCRDLIGALLLFFGLYIGFRVGCRDLIGALLLFFGLGALLGTGRA